MRNWRTKCRATRFYRDKAKSRKLPDIVRATSRCRRCCKSNQFFARLCALRQNRTAPVAPRIFAGVAGCDDNTTTIASDLTALRPPARLRAMQQCILANSCCPEKFGRFVFAAYNQRFQVKIALDQFRARRATTICPCRRQNSTGKTSASRPPSLTVCALTRPLRSCNFYKPTQQNAGPCPCLKRSPMVFPTANRSRNRLSNQIASLPQAKSRTDSWSNSIRCTKGGFIMHRSSSRQRIGYAFLVSTVLAFRSAQMRAIADSNQIQTAGRHAKIGFCR